LLQARLANPHGGATQWLDLACGRGQIIVHLRDNISELRRQTLAYYAYDIDNEAVRVAGKLASKLGFSHHEISTGEIRGFNDAFDADLRFDFVTLTNSVHEVSPHEIAQVLVHCVLRLSPDGQLFIYDMETLDPPELGAIPWNGDDAHRIVSAMLTGFASSYRPEVGRWQHTKTVGWNLTLDRRHVGCSDDEARARAKEAVTRTKDAIQAVLSERLARCQQALESLTKYGAETKAETDEKVRLLFEYWALSRTLGRKS